MKANRLAHKLITILAAAAIVALVPACGAPQTEGSGAGGGGDQAPPATEDLSFEGYDAVKLEGMRFLPEGLGRPGMPVVKLSKTSRLTLDKQREKFAAAKPERKGYEVMVLVTLLWEAVGNEEKAMKLLGDGDPVKEQHAAAAQKLREDARNALREVHAALGDKTDVNVLQMLFAAEMWTDDNAGALAAGMALLTHHSQEKAAQQLAPWVAILELTEWKTAEAAELTKDWKLEALNPDSDYLHAYAMAWVAFRQRRYDDANKAVAWAAKNWRSSGTRPAIERDLVLMLSRSGMPLTDADGILTELASVAAPEEAAGIHYVWLYKLYEGYELAGYSEHAAAALEKALEVLGDKVPPDNRVIIRQRQSNNYLMAHMPQKAADGLIAAYKAVAPCGDACKGKDEEIAGSIKKLGPHFHSTYTYTQDEAYYGPAKQLYEFYASLNRPDGDSVKAFANQLEDTKKQAAPGTGKHTKEIMKWSTDVRVQAVLASYERVLQSETELQGTLELILNVDDAGKVTGVDTKPAAGEAGMAAVAGYAKEQAMTWIFPARSKKGVTAVVRSYEFKPKAAQ